MNEHTLEDIHNYIEECRKELKTKVSWQVMGIVMTIIITIFGWLIASQVRQGDDNGKAVDRVSNVEGDIKSINTSLQYIQGSLKSIENKIK